MSDLLQELDRLSDGYVCTYSMAANEIRQLQAEVVQNSLDWERLASGQRRALDPSRQPIFDKLAERDALLKLLDDTPVGSEFRSDWEQWLKRRDEARGKR